MIVTSKISPASVKIFINDVLHIALERSKFIGLSSWQYSSEGGLYYIEIIMDGGTVAVDYDRRDLWEAVLAELEKLR